MRARAFARQPPGGGAIRAGELWALSRERDPARVLAEGLEARLGRGPIAFYASGRESLRVGLAALAAASRRDEVLLPAYGCYSLPAAAVAAGLRVRLVDVTPAGQLDQGALRAAPLERAAALVVANLFGVPEPVGALRALLRPAGVALVDDAAQALGASSPEGPVGGRGDLGLLSFGRGKPLSGLGGGALVGDPPDVTARPPCDGALGAAREDAARASRDRPTGASRPRRGGALARALAYDVARAPLVFRWLGLVPGLHVGETVYDPAFTRGPIDGAALCLAAAALARFDTETRARAARAGALADRIAAETPFAPILPAPGAMGVFPRLALRAPSAGARDAALGALRDLGATTLYPAALDALPELRPSLAGEPRCPGARELAARLLTVPTHAGLRGPRLARLVATLAGH